MLQELAVGQVPSVAQQSQQTHASMLDCNSRHRCVSEPNHDEVNNWSRAVATYGPRQQAGLQSHSAAAGACDVPEKVVASNRQPAERSTVAIRCSAKHAQQALTCSGSGSKCGSPAEQPRRQLPSPWQQSGVGCDESRYDEEVKCLTTRGTLV